MKLLSSTLFDFARPFVSRAFRGKRLSRLAAASLGVAVLTGVFAVWAMLSDSRLSHEIRKSVDVEQELAESDYRNYTVHGHGMQSVARLTVAAAVYHSILEQRHDDWKAVGESSLDDISYGSANRSVLDEVHYAIKSVEEAHGVVFRMGPRGFIDEYGEELWQIQNASLWGPLSELRQAYVDPRESPLFDERVLNFEAPALIEHYEEDHKDGTQDLVLNERDKLRLTAIAARNGRLEIRRYVSPMGLSDVAWFAFTCSGVLFTFGLLVVAPAMAGAQMSSEAHNNTLSPVISSGLKSWEVVTGMATGALAVVGLAVLPQLGLMLASSVVGGFVHLVVPGVAAVLIASVAACFVAQLMGYKSRRFAPSVTGVALVVTFVLTWLLSGVFAELILELDGFESGPGFLSFPGAAQIGWLSAPVFQESVSIADSLGIVANTLVVAVFGLFALRALSNNLEPETRPSLSFSQAWVGVGLGSSLAVLSVVEVLTKFGHRRTSVRFEEATILLALLVVPALGLMLMSRVSHSEQGANRRMAVQWKRLWGEYGLFLLTIAAVTAGGLCPFELRGALPEAPDFVALAWCAAIFPIVVIRVASQIPSVLGTLFAILAFAVNGGAYIAAIGGAFGDAALHDPKFVVCLVLAAFVSLICVRSISRRSR